MPTAPDAARQRIAAAGAMLGELATLPAADEAADGASAAAVARPGGAWHHLTDGRDEPADEIRAIRALLAERADAAPAGEQPHYEMLARELAEADGGEGLPEALIHPDFVLASVIASPEAGMVVVDWAGAGRGPRAWPLAFLLFAEGARNPGRAELVVSGYRRRVTLEPEEIERLPAMIRVRPVVLAAWSFCLGRVSGEQAARAVASAREVAQTAGPRVVAALRACGVP